MTTTPGEDSTATRRVTVRSSDVFRRQVGKNLRTLRLAAKLGQTALAAMVEARGVTSSQQAVDRTERGQRSMRAEEVATVAAVLGVPMSAIVTRDEDGRVSVFADLLAARAAQQSLATELAGLEAQVSVVRDELRRAEHDESEAQLRAAAIMADDEEPLPGMSAAS